MYNFVTARKPVDALSRAQAAIAGEPDPLVAPDAINGHVGAPLSRLILDAMELNREKRPASAAAMRERLRASFSGLPARETKTEVAPETSGDAGLLPTIVSGADVDSGPRGAAPTVPASDPGTRRRRTLVPLVVGVLVLIVLAGAGFLFLRRDGNRPAGDAEAGTEITVPAAAATPANPPAPAAAPQTSVSRLGGHTATVYGIDWSRDGRRIATAGNDSLAIIWDVATGRELKRIPLTGEGNSVAFSPDGRTLAVGITYSPTLNKSLVAFFGAESGSQLRSVYGEGGLIGNVTWSPDGRLLAFAEGSRVRVVDAGGKVRVFGTHENVVATIAFSRNGEYIASGALDEAINVWNSATGASVATIKAPKALRAVAFSPDAKTIAFGTYDEFLYLADAATGAVREPIPMPAFINALEFTSDGAMLVIALNRADDSMALFDLGQRKIVRRWGGPEGAGQRLRISPVGRKVLVAMGNTGEISNF
ncbi:MAG: WD40 repeat domain-containing protein [Thermoanaerobaculia bacterium]